jgi:hypothetical protein
MNAPRATERIDSVTTLRLVTILVLGAGLAAGVVACASDRVEPSVEDATAPTPAASHGGRPTGPPDPS